MGVQSRASDAPGWRLSESSSSRPGSGCSRSAASAPTSGECTFLWAGCGSADWRGRQDKVQTLGLIYLGSSPTLLNPAEETGLWSTSSCLHPLGSLIDHGYPVSTPSLLPACLSPLSFLPYVYVRFWTITQLWFQLRNPDARNLGSPSGVEVLC